MEEKMSRWGVGPIFALLSVVYGGIALAISRYFAPVFQIPLLPPWFLSGAGLVLIFLGILFLIFSVKAVTRAYMDYKKETPCILPFGYLKRLMR